MAKVYLKNEDPIAPVWVDARFSASRVPFDELHIVPEFPRWIQSDEQVEIEMGAWTEILYRRNLRESEWNLPPTTDEQFELYRVPMSATGESVLGRLVPPFEFIQRHIR